MFERHPALLSISEDQKDRSADVIADGGLPLIVAVLNQA